MSCFGLVIKRMILQPMPAVVADLTDNQACTAMFVILYTLVVPVLHYLSLASDGVDGVKPRPHKLSEQYVQMMLSVPCCRQACHAAYIWAASLQVAVPSDKVWAVRVCIVSKPGLPVPSSS